MENRFHRPSRHSGTVVGVTDSKQTERQKPRIIEVNGVRVRLYRASRMIGGKRYDYFRTIHFQPGKGRITRDFRREADAIAEAKSVAEAIGSGRHDVITLSRDDVAEFNLCRSKLAGTGVSLFGAVEGFLAYRAASLVNPRTVAEVVADYVADLPARRLSSAYIAHESQVGQKFATAFQCQLSSVSAGVFRLWLSKLKLQDGGEPSGRYLRNIHRSFTALVNFAARRGYATRDHAAQIAEIAAPKAAAPKCEVFTPSEFRSLLEASDEITRPSVVLGGF
jgi:hypothetical protein